MQRGICNLFFDLLGSHKYNCYEENDVLKLRDLFETVSPDIWDALETLKIHAREQGQQLEHTHQLHVPRPTISINRRARDLDPRGEVTEAMPVLDPVKSAPRVGWNKPSRGFWTSTAERTHSGWRTAWSDWTAENMPAWFSPQASLFRVRPGCLVLPMHSESDARAVYYLFDALGQVAHKPGEEDLDLRDSFPWNAVARHFDAVTHNGVVRSMYPDFLSGWDVESTAWFRTSCLTYVGEVRVAQGPIPRW